jgi:hypothetical protein
MTTKFVWAEDKGKHQFFWVNAFVEPVVVGEVKPVKGGKYQGICCNGSVGEFSTPREAMDEVELELWMFAGAINGYHVDKQLAQIQAKANKEKTHSDNNPRPLASNR